jgi:hypothetical protein
MHCRLLKYHEFPINSFIVALLVVPCFSVMGCGPSSKEREAQQKEANLRAKKQAESELLEQIASKFNPLSFPGKDISSQAFTYELQHFFKQHTGHALLFRAYMEDIEETEEGIMVEFTYRLGSDILNESRISFHLKANKDQAETLLNKPRPRLGLFFRSLPFIWEPDYFVIAKVHDISRARRYEFRGSAHRESEIELSVATPPRFVARGDLIEAISSLKTDDEAKTK